HLPRTGLFGGMKAGKENAARSKAHIDRVLQVRDSLPLTSLARNEKIDATAGQGVLQHWRLQVAWDQKYTGDLVRPGSHPAYRAGSKRIGYLASKWLYRSRGY